MSDLDAYVPEVIPSLRAVGTDLTTIEAKAVAGGLPNTDQLEPPMRPEIEIIWETTSLDRRAS